MVWYGWWKEDTILTAASLVQCGRREGGGGAGFQNLSRPHKAFNLRVKGNVAFWSVQYVRIFGTKWNRAMHQEY